MKQKKSIKNRAKLRNAHGSTTVSQPKLITKPSWPTRTWQQLSSKPSRKTLAILGTMGGFMLFFGALIATTYQPASEPTESLTQINFTVPETPPATPVTEPSPLTGLEVDPETLDDPITAVMIENSIDARPQSGLEESGVVFEAIAEGGITRFLAIYQHDEPTKLGPIRSARPYYVRWAAGFDARYVHSGGSPEALALIPNLGVKDLDHGRYGDQIAERVTNRFAPHNVYSSASAIDNVGDSAGFTTSDYEGMLRKEAAPEDIPDAQSITMNISGFNYNTSYEYRADENDYLRFMAGQPHSDAESGKQISPEVVVALDMSYGIHSNGIHSVYGSIGSGSAVIFQDGTAIEATWEKPTDTAPLTLNDASGDEIAINPGQTWFTAIQENRVSYK